MLEDDASDILSVSTIQVPRGTYPAVQRNAAAVRLNRAVPKPVVIVAKLNGQPLRALIDSGSLGDFVSSTLADQLAMRKEKLSSPFGLQLTVQGSRSKTNCGVKTLLEYQGISTERYFDVINVSQYDLILGTPWLFQHRMCWF